MNIVGHHLGQQKRGQVVADKIRLDTAADLDYYLISTSRSQYPAKDGCNLFLGPRLAWVCIVAPRV